MKRAKKPSLKGVFDVTKNYVVSKRKFIYLFLGVVLLLGLVFFGTKIYLALNLLIGHDSLVRLTSDGQDLFLVNSESVGVEFSNYVSTNPFCKSVCEYVFRDLSTGEVIDRGNFSTIIVNPDSRIYTLHAPDKGVGQKLYSFGVDCVTEKNSFCQTKGESVKKSLVVSLNYNLSDEQAGLREEAVAKLSEMIEDYGILEELYFDNLYLEELLRDKVVLGDGLNFSLENVFVEINESLELFAGYNYDKVLESRINLSNESLASYNIYLKGVLGSYNEVVALASQEEVKLNELVLRQDIGQDNFENVSLLISDYNDIIEDLNSSFNVTDKTLELLGLAFRVNDVSSSLNGTGTESFVFGDILASPLNTLVSNFTFEPTSISVPTESPICNYNGVSKTCCDETCSGDSSKYPVILLHGHSFNSGISAEKSLNDLSLIRSKLSSDGFLDGGDLILKDTDSLETFSKTRERVVFSGSYYFDIYQNTGETVVLETQSDDLDSYALRLDQIVDEVKAKTGKDKVVIAAHSMGGLVARKYIQIFGEDDIYELIMIGTPNHGINGTTLTGCSVFGEDKHCEDMDWKSLFMNKLNYGEAPSIPVKNIIGVGCDMNGEDGDGVVVSSSCYLSWADNYYVNGTCDGFNYLHSDLTDPELYGEVYDLVLDFLEEDGSSV